MARQPHKRHGYKLTPAADPLSIRKVPLSKQIWELKFQPEMASPSWKPSSKMTWGQRTSGPPWYHSDYSRCFRHNKSFSEWRAQMINKTRDRPLVQVLFESPYKQKLKIAGNIVVLYRSSTKTKFSPSKHNNWRSSKTWLNTATEIILWLHYLF